MRRSLRLRRDLLPSQLIDPGEPPIPLDAGEPTIPRTGGSMHQGQHGHRRRRLGAGSALIAAGAVGALCLPVAPASAATGPVSPTPVSGTPTLVDTGPPKTTPQAPAVTGTRHAGASSTK